MNVDDLDAKPWLGSTRDEAFTGLTRAFDTATALRAAGLSFVVAPLASRDRRSVRRLSARYAVSVVPFVDGVAGRWGESLSRDDRDEVLAVLAQLHEATPLVRATAPEWHVPLPGRDELDSALEDLAVPWTAGPLGERAHSAFERRRDVLTGWLARYDELAQHVVTDADVVVTHGEPHPGNMIHTDDGIALIDWDTVALAPRARDLWMVDDATVDRNSVELYRLRWLLEDLAVYGAVVRRPHEDDADARKALRAIETYLA